MASQCCSGGMNPCHMDAYYPSCLFLNDFAWETDSCRYCPVDVLGRLSSASRFLQEKQTRTLSVTLVLSRDPDGRKPATHQACWVSTVLIVNDEASGGNCGSRTAEIPTSFAVDVRCERGVSLSLSGTNDQQIGIVCQDSQQD